MPTDEGAFITQVCSRRLNPTIFYLPSLIHNLKIWYCIRQNDVDLKALI